MTKTKNYIPDGFNTVTPFLMVDGALELIEFMKKGLGGQQVFLMKDGDGKVAHANVKIGNSNIMLGDTMGDMQPQLAMLYLYVPDVDSSYKQAVKAGGESIHEPNDEYYGDRAAAVKDRWGNTWWFATQVEEVDQPELERRANEMAKKQKDEVPTH